MHVYMCTSCGERIDIVIDIDIDTNIDIHTYRCMYIRLHVYAYTHISRETLGNARRSNQEGT